MNWGQILTLISPIATISASVAVIVAAAIYYRQLKVMTKASELQSLLKILDYVDNSELRRARHFVYQHPECFGKLPNVPFTWEHWDEIDKCVRRSSNDKINLNEIDEWINALNNIGLLIKTGYAPKSILDEHMKNTFLHTSRAFGAYIESRQHRADLIGETSLYAQHFEWVLKEIKAGKLAKRH